MKICKAPAPTSLLPIALLGLLLLVVALKGPAFAGVMNPLPGDPLKIDSGRISGTLLDGGVKAYLGVPFAQPPVRDLRWHAPMPVKAWAGVYNADRKMPECVQGLRSPSINHYFGDELSGEDCLYLNIWEPQSARAGAKLPVVVWIYGGGFTGGSASMPIYGGEALARKGVVYVGINYRLGVFGFLAHPELTKESGHNASGNWGFLDQVAALQWVQRNIAAFGGDPANVTLVGQSAGSMSITNLQASPLARGLFKRVLGMSGTTLQGGAGAGEPLAQAEAQGVKLQTTMKAADIAAMRAVSSDKILSAAQSGQVRANPDIDGYYLPESVDAIFAAGRQNDVAVVTGSTANDIGTNVAIRRATTVQTYNDLARQMFGEKADAFLKLYPATTDSEARAMAEEVGRNSGFSIGARNWAKAQTATGKQPAYLFLLSRVQPFTPGVTFSDFDQKTAGAYHMGDVPYWLGTYETFNLFRTTRNWTAWDRQLSNAMQDVIVAYAKTGNPATTAVPFTRYSSANETRIDFGDSIRNEKLDPVGLNFLAANPPRAAQGGGRGGAPPSGPPNAPPSPTF